jgi:hypothetical protein
MRGAGHIVALIAHRQKCRNCLEHTFVLMPVSRQIILLAQKFLITENMASSFSRNNNCSSRGAAATKNSSS